MAVQEEIGILLTADFQAQGVQQGAEAATAAVDKTAVAFKRATVSSEQIERSIEEAGKTMKKTSQVFKGATGNIDKSLDKTAKSAINFSKTMEGAQIAALSFRQAITNAVVALRGRALGFIAAIVAATAAVRRFVGGVGEASRSIQSLEGSLKQIQGSTRSTSEQMEALRGIIETVSAYTGEGIEEVADYMSRFASLGISQREAAEALVASLTLASREGREARSVVEAILNTYRGSAEQAQQLGLNVAGLTKEQLEAGAAVDKIQEAYGKALSVSKDITQSSIENRSMMNELRVVLNNIYDDWKPIRAALSIAAGWFIKLNLLTAKLADHVGDVNDEIIRMPKLVLGVFKVVFAHLNLLYFEIREIFLEILAFPDQVFNKIDLAVAKFMAALGEGMETDTKFMDMLTWIDRVFRTNLVNSVIDFSDHWDAVVENIVETSGDAIDEISDELKKARKEAKDSIKELKELTKRKKRPSDSENESTGIDFDALNEALNKANEGDEDKDKEKKKPYEPPATTGNPLMDALVAGVKETLGQVISQTPQTTPAQEIMAMEDGSLEQLKVQIENVELGEESAQSIASAMLNVVAPGAGEALKLMLLNPEKLNTFIDNLGNGITIMLQKLSRNMGAIKKSVGRLVGAIASGIARALPDLLIAAIKDGSGIWMYEVAYDFAVEMVAQVPIIVKAWGDTIKSHFGDILERFGEFVKNIFLNPVETVKKGFGAVWDGLKGAGEYIVDSVAGIGDQFQEDVANRTAEISSGINNLDEKNEAEDKVKKAEAAEDTPTQTQTQFFERIAPITIGGVERTDQVLTAAEAFNPYVNEDAREDNQPIEIQINLGTQRLIEFNTDITETGTTTVLTA